MPTSQKSYRFFSSSFILEKMERLWRRVRERHARHYRDNFFHLWADLLLLGILVGLLIIVIWLMVWQPRPEFILAAHFSEAEVTSGTTQTLIINYENSGQSAVSGASVALRLPPHFTITQAMPAERFDKARTTFILGDIDKGGKGELRIQGFLVCEPDAHQAIEIEAMFQSGAIKKRLLQQFAYKVDASALELTMTAPQSTYRNSEFNIHLSLKNASDMPAQSVSINFPSADIDVWELEGKASNNTLSLGDLAPGETREFDASARGKNLGEGIIRAEASVSSEGTQITQAKALSKIMFTEPDLEINASLKEKFVSAISSRANLNINVKNLENEDISDLSFTVLPTRRGVAIGKMDSMSGALARGSSLFGPARLAPGSEAAVSAVIELTRDHVVLNDSTGINISVAYSLHGEQREYVVSAGNLLFSSNFNLSSGGYYYGPQGDQLGVGPLPPVVDIPTTYWIIWQINNLGNDMNDVQLSAELPDSIAWNDQQSVSAGELNFSPVSRRIVWRPGPISAKGGNYRANFAISLVPTAAEVGTTPLLLKNIRMSGTDAFSGEKISKNSAEITTNLEKDPLSGGKATVRLSE